MITYRIDKTAHTKINAQIREMDKILAEIPNSLQVLQTLLEQQAATISSPSINNYRADLSRRVSDAIEKTRQIANDSGKLIAVSEQAAKHLSAIEEHFGAVLRENQPITNDVTPADVTARKY